MNSIDRFAKNLVDIFDSQNSKKVSAYDTTATVLRVEDGTAWVHIPGGVEETPVKLTVACGAGDEVQVRVGGGRAWIVGNASAPPTDDKKANYAIQYTNDVHVQVNKDIEEVNEEVSTKTGLNDIGQRNLIRNSKTMIFEDYGYDVEGGLTDENDSTLIDESGTVLTDGTPAKKDITTVPVASSVDTSNDKAFINQGDAIKQVSISAIISQAGGDKHYTYTQSIPSDTWVIQHNLGKCPDVTVVDSAGSEVIGDCEYTDTNSVTLTFSGAFGGVAYLN